MLLKKKPTIRQEQIDELNKKSVTPEGYDWIDKSIQSFKDATHLAQIALQGGYTSVPEVDTKAISDAVDKSLGLGTYSSASNVTLPTGYFDDFKAPNISAFVKKD